jgi:hypothetical protein
MLAAACFACPGPQSPDPGDLAPPPVVDAPAERLPMARTPPSELSNDELLHTELLRIRRNFGKEQFEIALDAWVAAAAPGQLADLRLWWARTDRDGERSPFGEGTRENFTIEYETPASDRWRVHLVSDRKRFTFDVEIGEDAVVRAFADVMVGAQKIQHCRAVEGELQARRLLGAPIGIKKLELTCIAADGTQLHGRMLTERGD